MNKQQRLVSLVECPRDAMQGWPTIISTADKISYLNDLLSVGFDVLDCGSFVSAKAIPQMADTPEVIPALKPAQTKLLVIVANKRGAEEAVKFPNITYLGYPFSISPTFQMRNTNSTIDESWQRLQDIQSLCIANNKEMVVYISMGFGNPYGDLYNPDVISTWIERMQAIGIKTISLADTVGVATPDLVYNITSSVINSFDELTIGVHLHSTLNNWQLKLEAALQGGCMRFDGALKGIGGCPMANDTLVGNMDSELMIGYFRAKQILPDINEKALTLSIAAANKIFELS